MRDSGEEEVEAAAALLIAGEAEEDQRTERKGRRPAGRSDRGNAPASRCGSDGEIWRGRDLDEAAAVHGGSLSEKKNKTEM